MKDVLDREIGVGDVISYAVGTSSSVHVKVADVLEAAADGVIVQPRKGENYTGRKVTLRHGYRVTIIHSAPVQQEFPL